MTKPAGPAVSSKRRSILRALSIVFFALGTAACTQPINGDPLPDSEQTTIEPIPMLDVEILHGGWEVEIDGTRIVLAFNKQGTWTYDTGCSDPVTLGSFAIENGGLVIIEFGMQLESDTCTESERSAKARFIAVLGSFDSVDLDERLLTLASAEDEITLSRIS